MNSIDRLSPEVHEQPVVPAQELWFTATPANLDELKTALQQQRVTSTVRLEDRSGAHYHPKGSYLPGRFITLKLQTGPNEFDPYQPEVVVTNCRTTTVGQLTAADLAGAIIDGATPAEAQQRLAAASGRPAGLEEVISMVDFEYAAGLKTAGDLIRVGSLRFARQPKDNPTNLDFPAYTLPLQEHDYPARTPTMWNAAYKQFGLDRGNAICLGDPTFAEQVLKVLRRDSKYLGGGCGVGFKDEVIHYLDELDSLAEAIGAVNFILKTPTGSLRGYNTDGRGYAQGLADLLAERGQELKGQKAVILGAGGTGNAVAFALAEAGMQLVILNRTTEKARELAGRINRYCGQQLATAGSEAEIAAAVTEAAVVINVSTKGAAGAMEQYSALAPATLPATAENIAQNQQAAAAVMAKIAPETIISDVVLTAEGTPLLRSAKAKGFTTLDGLPMVINQGVEAFWLLHGPELEPRGVTKAQVAEVMRAAAYAV